MNLKSLVIRADSSAAMGTGHIMRCLALAQAWQDQQGEAAFVIADPLQTIRARIESEHCEVLPISCIAGNPADSKQTIALAREKQAAWVAVDGYQFGAEYQSALKSAGFKVLFIDDYGHARRYEADLILNQNAGASANLYAKCASYSRMLLGPRYCLLRREFSGWREWEREIPPVGTRVLVTMGGSDPENLTTLVIRALGLVENLDVSVTVVAGASNPRLPMLRGEAMVADGRILFQDSVSNMADLMANSDLAIIAGGGTLWELLYMSCPVLSFGNNALQRGILDRLHEEGVIRHLGDPRQVDPATLAQIIEALIASESERAKMAMLGRRQVDGEGAKRVCEALEKAN